MAKRSKVVTAAAAAKARERREETMRQAKFVAHYVVHCNGAAAARYAGYSVHTARQVAYELLTKPDIQAAVEERRKQIGVLHFDLANQALAQYVLMRAADPMSLFDDDGVLLPPNQWPEAERALVVGFEVEEVLTSPKDDAPPVMTRISKVKFESRKGVLDSINRVLGRFVDKSMLLGKDGKPVDPPGARPVVLEISVGGKPVTVKVDE